MIDPNGGLILHDIEFYRFDEASKNYALWGFFMPQGGLPLSLTAVGTNGIDGEMTVSIRRCCYDVDTEVDCATGSSLTGVTLETMPPPGNYTVVVTTDRPQDVILTWDSPSIELIGSSDNDNCPTYAGAAYPAAIAACENKLPIFGTGRDPQNPNQFLMSIQPTFYDGQGYFEAATCDQTYNESVVTSADLVYEADMTDAAVRDTWVTGPETNPFLAPTYGSTANSLTLSATDRDGVFGYWSRDGIAIPEGALDIDDSSPVAIFRATYRLAMAGGDTPFDPRDVPDIRVRLGTNTFQRVVEGALISLNDGVTVPEPGEPKELEVYMVLEEVPTSLESLVAGFDLLAFYPEDDFPNRDVLEDEIHLELVRIERVNIPNYPAPR
jgi:hypothetical protein